MSRVVLVHWNAGEAEERAERLRGAGFEAVPIVPRSGADLREFRDHPPAAFVIDLGRQPTQGRAVAIKLRQWTATRGVPIVFVDGQPEKVASVLALLPDADHAEWGAIKGTLRRAISRPAKAPVVVPGTMAGYSGTPLPKKLGIRAGSVVALLGAPPGFERTLGALPEGARLSKRAQAARVVIIFVKSRADLARRFPVAARALAEGGALWIAWPKKASGVRTDLAEQDVRAFGLGRAFVDYKICAIDATWSGLCFARRRPG